MLGRLYLASTLYCRVGLGSALNVCAQQKPRLALSPKRGAALTAGLQRGVTCLATEEGALMVQISRELFLSFVVTQPKALQVYLQKVPAACC